MVEEQSQLHQELAPVLDAPTPFPWNEITDPELYQNLLHDLTVHGWKGAPVVVDRASNEAVTGSHRIRAAVTAGVCIPVVYLDDLFAVYGLDWHAWLDRHDGDLHEAARMLDYAGLPDNVVDYYGFDVH